MASRTAQVRAQMLTVGTSRTSTSSPTNQSRLVLVQRYLVSPPLRLALLVENGSPSSSSTKSVSGGTFGSIAMSILPILMLRSIEPTVYSTPPTVNVASGGGKRPFRIIVLIPFAVPENDCGATHRHGPLPERRQRVTGGGEQGPLRPVGGEVAVQGRQHLVGGAGGQAGEGELDLAAVGGQLPPPPPGTPPPPPAEGCGRPGTAAPRRGSPGRPTPSSVASVRSTDAALARTGRGVKS